MGVRAPSPPPGDPDYVGPVQYKPTPPPPPPAKRADVRAEGRWELLKLWLERQRSLPWRGETADGVKGYDLALEQIQIKMRDIETFIPDTPDTRDKPDTHHVTTSPEQVVCSAIRFDDGTIIRGHRHNDCLRTAGSIPIDFHPQGRPTHGFMTTRNRFVGRVQARELQEAAGVEPKRGSYQNELYSEDVY